ncbi:tetratricopeptide repeat protein [Streptomyces sp. WZ-12]|uniref:tetratricopeptide repeat protein n=1 Tax=Streptomyces sp. WZ-12 TaxID=3030210 RepID=UPI0023812859|nr:tetratricopeptide repeat protein [Streptomyces sp. WZ-12]
MTGATRGADEIHNNATGTVSDILVQIGRNDGEIHLNHPRRAPAVPRQLPPAPDRFIGREGETAQLTAAHDAADRGATLIIAAIGGTGGIGKTWLALHWAHRHADRFPDGQLFVDLRGFHPSQRPMTPQEAIRGFLDALGVPPTEIPAEPAAQLGLYRSLVADRRLLIVLDNAHDSAQVDALLPGTPTCTVLVTSRYHMAGLITAHSARSVTVHTLDDQGARALLTRHLGERRVTDEPAAVAEILTWCAGLPLALSIVTARARLNPTIPLAALAEELRDASSRLDALAEEPPMACLETVLSWSYEQLTDEQATVFGLLGTAPGSDISLPAATSLVGRPASEVRRVLRHLERVSLVQQQGAGRYWMHDLVRLCAATFARCTQEPAALEEALRRLAECAAHTAHTADRLIAPHHAPIELGTPGPGCRPQSLADATEAWAWFAAERVNLMAVQHAAAERSWHPQVWQLAWTLTTFQLRQGHLQDNLTAWKAGAAASNHLDDPRSRTRSYRHLGRAHAQLGQHEAALVHLQDGLAGAERDGDRLGQAHTHRAIAIAWEQQGQYQRALDHVRRALHLYEDLDVKVSGSHARNEVGWYLAKLGHYEEARRHCDQALQQCRAAEDRSGQARTLLSLGYLAHHTGHHDEAADRYRQALALYRDLGDTSAQADTLDHLGHTLAPHNKPEAHAAWHQALTLYTSQHRPTETHRLHPQLTTLASEDSPNPPQRARSAPPNQPSTGKPSRRPCHELRTTAQEFTRLPPHPTGPSRSPPGAFNRPEPKPPTASGRPDDTSKHRRQRPPRNVPRWPSRWCPRADSNCRHPL